MRNLLSGIVLFVISCTGANPAFDHCLTDLATAECRSDTVDALSTTNNCAQQAFACVVFTCTKASEDCARSSTNEACFACIDRAINGALCRYFIDNCQTLCKK